MKNKTIAEWIRNARISKGFTIKKLADAVGVTEQSIIKFEKGTITPRLHTMIDIVNALGYEFNLPEIK